MSLYLAAFLIVVLVLQLIVKLNLFIPLLSKWDMRHMYLQIDITIQLLIDNYYTLAEPSLL